MGGELFCPFCPRGQGGGYVKYPRLSTQGEEGVKNGQNLVHVVVECPLRQTVLEKVRCLNGYLEFSFLLRGRFDSKTILVL